MLLDFLCELLKEFAQIGKGGLDAVNAVLSALVLDGNVAVVACSFQEKKK